MYAIQVSTIWSLYLHGPCFIFGNLYLIFGNVFDMENIVACQLTCAAQQRRQRLVDRTSCLLSLGQSKPELLLKCPALLSGSDINAFKISVKRLLAIFLPPPLPGPHGQLHPDVHLIVLLLG